jgi:hypothetical protein
MLGAGSQASQVDTVALTDGAGNATFASGTFTGSGIPINSGTSSNTDLAGQVTLSGGTFAYTFTATYTHSPICVATDTTAANVVQVVVTTTTLTLNGTSTDVLNYVCIGRT